MYDSYKDIFEQRGLSYHQAMLSAPNARDEEFQNAIRILTPKHNSTLVDFPAGGGYLSNYVSHDVKCIHIETSRQFYDLLSVSVNAEKALGQFDSLPLKDDSADYLVSIAALHHVPNLASFFSEVRRVIKQSGELLIADVAEDSQVAGFLNGFVNEFNSMGHVGVFLSENTLLAASQCGLELKNKERLNFEWRFETKSQMVDFCSNLFGLDLATKTDVLNGINQFLTPKFHNEYCALTWQLTYLKFGLTSL